jgi:hypothetical protein
MDQNPDGKIPVWFWGEAANTWFSVLVEDAVYEFSGGEVEALGKYATTNMRYRISFAHVESVAISQKAGVSAIPRMAEMLVTDFVTLKGELDGVRVAIKGCIKSVSNIVEGTQKSTRVVSITDEKNSEIELTLYDAQVRDVTPEMTGKVVCMFEVSVRSFWKPQLSGNAFMSIKLMG